MGCYLLCRDNLSRLLIPGDSGEKLREIFLDQEDPAVLLGGVDLGQDLFKKKQGRIVKKDKFRESNWEWYLIIAESHLFSRQGFECLIVVIPIVCPQLKNGVLQTG